VADPVEIGAEDAYVRPQLVGAPLSCELVGMPCVVGVEERDPRLRSGEHACVAGGTGAGVRLLDHAGARVARNLPRAIAPAVVDDDRFGDSPRLRANAVQRATERTLVVERRDDRRDRQRASRHA